MRKFGLGSHRSTLRKKIGKLRNENDLELNLFCVCCVKLDRFKFIDGLFRCNDTSWHPIFQMPASLK